MYPLPPLIERVKLIAKLQLIRPLQIRFKFSCPPFAGKPMLDWWSISITMNLYLSKTVKTLTTQDTVKLQLRSSIPTAGSHMHSATWGIGNKWISGGDDGTKLHRGTLKNKSVVDWGGELRFNLEWPKA